MSVSGRRVVITGVGVVSPCGVGRGPFWDAMLQGRSGIDRIRVFDLGTLPISIGGEVRDFQGEQYVKPRKAIKLMCRESQLSYAAVSLAIQDAGNLEQHVDPERLGIVFGSEMFYGLPAELVPTYRACQALGEVNTVTWGQVFPKEMFPLWLLLYLPNMPGCHVAIAHQALGPNNTIVQGAASGILSLIEGVTLIERDWVDAVIVGSVGSGLSLTREVYLTHDHLSRAVDDPPRACRPFDAHRDGTVAAEGAAVLILEDQQRAAARGIPILAEVRGFARGWGLARGPSRGATRHAIRDCLARALREARIERSQIGHVNAHAGGLVDSDAEEAWAIHEVLGNTPVTAPKSYLGHAAAGCGVLEAAVSVLAIFEGIVPPTLNYSTYDPQCPVQVIRDGPLDCGPRPAVTLNHSTTGQVAALVMAPYSG